MNRMATIRLDARQLKDLQPARSLWALYDPQQAPYRFSARTLAQARKWQEKTKLCS